VVFTSGIPITLIPLDCTHGMLTTAARVAKFKTMPNRVGPAVAALLEFFERFDEHKYGTDGGPLHDPCVIAWLLQPDLFKGKDVNVAIEQSSELTMGMTVIDWWGASGRPVNTTVIRAGDADRFFALLTERIAKLP
jgi:purine nucleosidase